MLAAIAVILGSLSFWFSKSDIISDTGNSLMINFATYPDGIFKGLVKGLLYTLIPVGIINYILISFDETQNNTVFEFFTNIRIIPSITVITKDSDTLITHIYFAEKLLCVILLKLIVINENIEINIPINV